MRDGDTETCRSCKFFRYSAEAAADQCRRRAPVGTNYRMLRYHDSELLRDVAWSLRRLAMRDPPQVSHDLEDEATDYPPEKWPTIDPDDDWCGEFEKP